MHGFDAGTFFSPCCRLLQKVASSVAALAKNKAVCNWLKFPPIEPAHDEIGEAAKHAKVLLAQHQFRQNTELVGSHSISSLPISVLDVLVPVVGQYAARAL